MKPQFKKRRFIPVALALAAVIAVSGVAYAYWSSNGAGPGSAGVGTSVPFVVTQTGTVPSGLVPGGAAQNVTVHVVNNATFSQSVTAVVITVTLAVNGTDVQGAPGCLASWFTIGAAPGPYPFAIAASGNHDFVGTIALTNDVVNNQNACKSVSIPLTLTVS